MISNRIILRLSWENIAIDHLILMNWQSMYVSKGHPLWSPQQHGLFK
jgi:hypothetical protein